MHHLSCLYNREMLCSSEIYKCLSPSNLRKYQKKMAHVRITFKKPCAVNAVVPGIEWRKWEGSHSCHPHLASIFWPIRTRAPRRIVNDDVSRLILNIFAVTASGTVKTSKDSTAEPVSTEGERFKCSQCSQDQLFHQVDIYRPLHDG